MRTRPSHQFDPLICSSYLHRHPDIASCGQFTCCVIMNPHLNLYLTLSVLFHEPCALIACSWRLETLQEENASLATKIEVLETRLRTLTDEHSHELATQVEDKVKLVWLELQQVQDKMQGRMDTLIDTLNRERATNAEERVRLQVA